MTPAPRMTRRLRNWRRRAVRQINKRAGVYRQKVFCVGRNKTGTTTMTTVLTDYGFRMGPQREAERFVHDHQGDMQPSFWDWVDAHEAFQDVPFSTTWLLPELFARYPDALYILRPGSPIEIISAHHTKPWGFGEGPLLAVMHQHAMHNRHYTKQKQLADAIFLFFRETIPNRWQGFRGQMSDDFCIVIHKNFRVLAG